MKGKKISTQYGLWKSQLSPKTMAQGLTLRDLAYAEDGTLIWLENRSDRGVLVVKSIDDQATRDLNAEYSVRARVGYGGGDFTVGNGFVYFVDSDSGRIFKQPVQHGRAEPLTPAFGNCASPCLSPDGTWLLFVHSYEEQDCVGIVANDGSSWPIKLISGADFYMSPTWHPDGEQIAWISWNHPNMPWNGTNLYLGKLSLNLKDDVHPLCELQQVEHIAGAVAVSVFQPQFSPDGKYLAYISDETGWWQLYLRDLTSGEVHQITPQNAEHARPAWVQGQRSYCFTPDSRAIYFIRNMDGSESVWFYDLTTEQEAKLLDDIYTGFAQIAINPRKSTHQVAEIAVITSGGTTPTRLITYRRDGEINIIRRTTSEEIASEFYSHPQPLSWQGYDGEKVFGLFFPPTNPVYSGVGVPPLVVNIHGGPTSQVRTEFNACAQFLATRGYAVLEVNYRGSTGYGRDYWEKLASNWGIYDVQDAIYGAKFLVDKGLVDGTKMVIMGGSAGGFTVLKALTDHPGFFKAGICLYGISNQFTAATDTHKFEVRYSDWLLGPLPQATEIYRERSPLFFIDRLQDALALFQGEDDKVVPRSQSDEVVASLINRGVPHIYRLYPGEGHGFRKSETIEDFYTQVEKFLTQYVIYG